MSDALFYFMRKNPVDLLRYLPKFLSEDPSFKELEGILSQEHELLRLKLVDITRQFFLETATWGLADWEDFLGITPREGQSFEARKAVARAKLRGAETMTVENTIKLMENFMIIGSAGVEELGNGEIRLILDNGTYFWQELFQALLEYLPAHLEFSLKFHQHRELEIFTAHPAVNVDKNLLDILPIIYLNHLIYTANVIENCDINVIDYGTTSIDEKNSLSIGYILGDASRIEINAEVEEETEDWDFELWLWWRWQKWKKNALIKEYAHHFGQKDEPFNPDEPADPQDEDFPFEQNFLRLYFEYTPTRIQSITLRNPREDLTGADINKVGRYAAANRTLKNRYGEYPRRIVRALLVTKSVENILGGQHLNNKKS